MTTNVDLENKKYIIEEVKKNYKNEKYKGILDEFLRIIGIDINHYNLISGQKKTELAKTQVLRDDETYRQFINNANEFISTEPKDWLSDVAFHLIRVLDLLKHDYFIDMITDHIEFKLISKEFKIKDHFPINSLLTPDLLFYNNEKYFTIEVKVRKSVDLEYYYKKYKDILSEYSDVDVVNFNINESSIIYQAYGDNKLYLLNLMNTIPNTSELYQTILYINNLVEELYSKYNKFDSFRKIGNETIDVDFDYISKFTMEDIESLKCYNEIKDQFGLYWEKLVADLDYNIYDPNFKIDEEQKFCEESMMSYIDKHKHDLFSEITDSVECNSYLPTRLIDSDILKSLDDRNSKKYTVTTKLKPSIYMNLGHTDSKLDRTEYYMKIFNEVKLPSKISEYSLAMISLLRSVFCGDYSKYLINCEKAIIDENIGLHEDYLEYRKSNPTSQKQFTKSKMKVIEAMTSKEKINIYMNSVFTWSDKHGNREKIIKYKKPKGEEKLEDIQKTKGVLRITDYVSDYKFIEEYLQEFYKLIEYPQFMKDMSTPSHGQFNLAVNGHQLNTMTKYYHLMHTAFKNMISLSVINNTKFRLIQTNDKSNFFIMLPNADFKDHKPVRYINITIMDKKNSSADKDYLKFCRLMGLMDFYIENKNEFIIVSKVISLDLTRVKILSNSLFKFMILRSYYEHIKVESNDEENKDIAFSFLTPQLATLNSLSVTDTYKNLIMVSYSGFSNLDELISDKFNPTPKNISQCYISYKCARGLIEAAHQSSVIDKAKKDTYYDDSCNEIVDKGFEATILKLPITGYNVSNPKEVFHESFILFYLGNKGLHGSPQETLNLYSISIEFEEEYSDFLSKHKSVLQEVSKIKDYGFSFEAMYLSSKYTYSLLLTNHKAIRSSLLKNYKLSDSPLSVPQFSSTKSMVKSTNTELDIEFPKYLKFPEHKDIDFTFIQNWLKNTKLSEIEMENFCERNNKVIKTINEHRKNKFSKEQAKINRDEYSGLRHDKPYNQYRHIPDLTVEGHSLKFVRMKNTYFYTNNCDQYIDCSSSKVMEEVYNDCELKGHKTLDEFLTDIKDDNSDIVVRVFNKDQRTFEDREIYTCNLLGRKLLYPLEMTFKSINENIFEEAITTPGEKKQKNMLIQRKDIIKDKILVDRMKSHFGRLYSVSSDASKWSARDIVFKFLIPIFTSPFLLKEEKIHLAYCIIRYYDKKICLTDKSLLESMKFYNKEYIGDVYAKMTDNFHSNNWLVRSNWLQGNLNNTSSFVHVCAANMSKLVLNWWNNKFHDALSMRYMVHSDDSTYDFMLLWSRNNMRFMGNFFENPDNTGKFIIPILKYVLKLHCIKLNEKKTYISSYFKEFLSTIMMGNELTFNYVQDLLPICNDTSYVSPIDDLSSYTGFLNNAYAHLCPSMIIQDIIPIINHLTSSSYNLHNSSNKSPAEGLGISEMLIADIPIQIDAKYKLPIDVAGCLPYYTADAFEITTNFHEFIKKRVGNDLEPIENYLTHDYVNEYLFKYSSESYLNYIKLCVMSQDLSIYEEDFLDSYNQKAVDQFNSSLITIAPVIKRGKLIKYKTYKEYMNNLDTYKNNVEFHPEWVLKKPTSHEESKQQLISNFSNGSYTNSLIYNSAELDFARRVMDSNKNIYKLNLKDYKNKAMSISEIYKTILSELENLNVSSTEFINYLYINLFNNKKYSVFTHVYLNKKLINKRMKKTIYKVSPNKTIYSGLRFDLSNYDLLYNSLIDTLESNLDFKNSSHCVAIDYFYNYISSLKIPKIYDSVDTIDENFKNYIKLKYDNEDYESFLPLLNQCREEEYRLKLFEIKTRFLSICINNFYRITNINPKTILLNFNSYIIRSKVNTKIFMSINEHNDIISFWLERIGLYSSNYMFYDFMLGKDIFVTGSDDMIIQESNSKTRLLSNLAYNVMKKDPELFDELFFRENLFPDISIRLRESRNLFDNFLYFKINRFEDCNEVTKKLSETNMYNYWYLKENENADNNFDVVYQSKGTFINFSTKNGRKSNEKILNVKRLSANYNDISNVNRIIAKFKEDIRVYLKTYYFKPCRALAKDYKSIALYSDNFNSLTTSSKKTVKIANIDWININELKVEYKISDNYKSISCLFKKGPLIIFKFDIKDTNRLIQYDQFKTLVQLIKADAKYSLFLSVLPAELYMEQYSEFIYELILNSYPSVIKNLFLKKSNFNVTSLNKIKNFLLKHSQNISEIEEDEFIAKLIGSLPMEKNNPLLVFNQDKYDYFRLKCNVYKDAITRNYVHNKYIPVDQSITNYICGQKLSFEDSIAYITILKFSYSGLEFNDDEDDEEGVMMQRSYEVETEIDF
ncbi:RNA dependent RNA polymerase [Emaravirus verbanni]|uniref:RNA-directed RNA polymerase L n=1 Tax=Emaravirus verbanni TaxID=2843908 RepID=A0A6B9EKX1_9VIRU|nr:RNA dependent RNA polymerase [Emaravirus verbanni]QGX73507.1 RNA dependent RNA polymerase [Emaravirus verbanni]